MTRLAIVEPLTLVGQELQEKLSEPGMRWTSMELYSSDPHSIGAVTEAGGRAALVQQLEAPAMSSVDLVFFCGGTPDREALAALPETSLAVLIDPQEAVPSSVAVVDDVNLDQAAEQRIVVSPNPGVMLLARVLHPLTSWHPVEVVAHLMQPASVHDKRGLDELFEQTRSILSMAEPEPQLVYGTQVAFNLLPGIGEPALLLDQLQSILGLDAMTAISLTRVGVFHCYAASLFLRLEKDPGLELLAESLAEASRVALASQPELLGPIQGAARDAVLMGAARAAPGVPGGYWLWGVMDNLASSVANAMAIAAAR